MINYGGFHTIYTDDIMMQVLDGAVLPFRYITMPLVWTVLTILNQQA